jgi:hypothetical protein
MGVLPNGMRWLFVACGLVFACGGTAVVERPAPVFAAASGLPAFSPKERQLLEDGAAVHRERELTHGDRGYLGTVSYQLVNARASTVMETFHPSSLVSFLPNTKRATLLQSSRGVWQVELAQGNDWVTAEYTVYLRREDGAGLRFWLDQTRPHDIDDAWGYFRAEPFDSQRTLVTVAVAVDIGSGLLTGLFANAVQASILTTPARIKRHVERAEGERRSREAQRVLAYALSHPNVHRLAPSPVEGKMD